MMTPEFRSLLLALIAQVLWMGVVWVWLYVTRIGTMQARKIPTQDLADPVKFDLHLAHVAGPAENFENQFEIPVLFALAVLAIGVTGKADLLYAQLAWVFVFTRVIHSLIHMTYNLVLHRFIAYAVGSILIWWMWVRFGLQVFLDA